MHLFSALHVRHFGQHSPAKYAFAMRAYLQKPACPSPHVTVHSNPDLGMPEWV